MWKAALRAFRRTGSCAAVTPVGRSSLTPQGGNMSEAEGRAVIGVWTGVCWFFSLWYLGNRFWVPLLASIFAVVTITVGPGSRRLVQIGTALSLVAIAVAMGFPHPTQWPAALAGIPELFVNLKIATAN